MSFETIIKRLQDGPSILFVGQNYLSLDTGSDYILQKVASKYLDDNLSDLSYQLFTKLDNQENKNEIFHWLQGLCKSISTPYWLEEIAKYPWSSVYTSVYDTILERAFETEFRSTQPIVNDSFILSDPRNKSNLHISYLLGYIATASDSDLPPTNLLQQVRRRNVSNSLLSRIPSLVTPKGIIVIEGYSLKDQLSIGDLYTYLSTLGQNQILICSADEELMADPMIKDLIESKKAVVTNSSFAILLTQWVSEGKIRISEKAEDDYYGKWLTLPNERVKIPEDLISRVSKTAFIVDDSVFYENDDKDDEQVYNDFRRFLSSTNVFPDWEGYIQGFAFKRDYYQKLKTTVLNNYNNRDYVDKPIVLEGQTSSGKTVSFGLLTYELRKECKYPVLFIPKRYRRPDEMTIDLFCRWAEENKAKYTVIIWDGMVEMEAYYRLLTFLNARGRNIILVCSCYIPNSETKTNYPSNYIHAPIQLTKSEKDRFVGYLKSVNSILANIVSSTDEPNLLALLYRHLPSNLSKIRSGLHDEYQYFVTQLKNITINDRVPKTDLFELLSKAGLISEEDLTDDIINKQVSLSSETVSVADFLIFSIMVSGQHGLNVPFELLLDSIGFDAFATHIFQALNSVDLIKWFEDEDGNIELGPRTTLEASILSKFAGGKRAEVSYIIELLKAIKTNPGVEFGGWDRQVEFAVQLLYEIGPNSNSAYLQSYYAVTQILRSLRENRVAYHPRLVLKEASFLRSIVKQRNKITDVTESDIELLDRAERIVRQALDDLGMNSNRMIAAYLRVELSTICGFLLQKHLDDPEIARDYYWQIRSLNNYSFSTNPSNYHALDIAAWTTQLMLEGKFFTENDKIEAQTDLLSLFERVEAEGVNEEHEEDFKARKVKFYEIIGDTQLAQEVFDDMLKKGFTYGIYLRARKKLGFLEENTFTQEIRILKNKETFNYLQGYFEQIKNDGRCLFLLLKTWWVSKTSKGFFEEDRQSLALSKIDWDFCLQITSLLLANEEKYQSATVYYLYGLSLFHLDFIREAMETFKSLQGESFSYGRRRIVKHYMLSLSDGMLRSFSGEVKENVSRAKNEKRGEIYVADLGINIPFSLFDFGQTSFQKGQKITNFNIAFNFLGPIAVPSKN